jgi:2-hydroxychromene-2-carboxylate isomerase
MTRVIDYYLSAHSTWAYLGHDAFLAIALRRGAAIRFKPVPLAQLFPETGGLPLAKRHPARQRYRLVEMRRWRALRGLPMELVPAYVPFDPALADQVGVALSDAPDVCGRYFSTAMRGVWTGQNLADEATIRAHVAAAGGDPDLALAKARSEQGAAGYAANMREAMAADVFGSPSYVLDGEVFWGQDRLDQLDAALASGRPAYRPS